MKDIFSFSPEFKKGLSIALCIMVLFSLGFLAGEITKANVTIVTGTESSGSAASEAPSEAPTVAPSEAPTVAPSEAPTVAPTPGEPTVPPSTDSTPAGDANSSGKSTAEILAIFNDSANKVKTNATKVVKNYEDRTLDEENLKLPSVLQPMAKTMIPQFMGDDTEPIEYATREDIVANYQVPNQDYVSKLTEADIEAASFKDNGTEYEIELKVKNETSPSAGKGVGAAFDVIEAGEITNDAPFVESFTTDYHDCVVKCKIDKASGNMTWANYMTPLVLNVTVKMFGTHDLALGLSFEKDYTITY